MARNLAERARARVSDWWDRVSWGALVIVGPILCYVALLIALDIVGLSSDRESYFRALYPDEMFRAGLELDLYSIAGRSEYALTASVYFILAAFSIVWAVPLILQNRRNPYGGAFGLLIAGGLTLSLYALYLGSSYNLRTAFADDILKLAESRGVLGEMAMRMQLFGVDLFGKEIPPSKMLETVHAFVYFFGNAAPWCLIVVAACSASFEPGVFGKEPHSSLRRRMVHLQMAVVLGAANIVLSVAYLRAMLNWPTNLLVDDLASDFAVASIRYTAIWGAIGTLMMIAVLAPAYISLNRHYDRVARFERERDGDEYVSYRERKEWRAEHGLNLTSQEILATAAAVFAPLLTAPALEQANNYTPPPPPAIEQRLGQ